MIHDFQSSKTQGSDATIASKNEWNAVHRTKTTALSANTTLDSTHDAILATAGAGGITLTLPAAASNAGRTYRIIKVDSAAGAVTIDANASETINGDLTYALKRQYELIEIVCDGSNWLVSDVRVGFSIASQTIITTTGNSTYTVPAGVKAILVEVIGGGGGGGSADGAASSAGAGGGGGSGGYASKLYIFPASSYSVTVGTGGAGGVAQANGATGTAGNDSVFDTAGSPVTAKGGAGGSASGTAASTVAAVAGGAGGAVSTGGDVNCGGNPGGPGIRLAAAQEVGGNGGSSVLGGGGAGTVNATGGNATNYGAGGGGAGTNGNTDRAGGNGSQGVIIVTEYK
jgi:hypothetical protein